MAFTTRIKVRFGDVDRAGIAYYPNLYHFCHVAFEEFFEHFVGISYPRLIEEQNLGFPTVRVESYFRRPVKYGDTLEVRVGIARVGESSVTFEFRASRAGEGQLLFATSHICVGVDMKTFQPMRIPDDLRETFRKAGAALEGSELE
jgi:YbgC/YbaW family acyl-CoA thioester hydrolase